MLKLIVKELISGMLNFDVILSSESRIEEVR